MSAEAGRRTKIAIIGDRFMTPSTFEAAIRARCDEPIDIATMQLPWPDEPMRHGYAEPGMDGLKEYQGDAEAIIGFVGSAEIAITQLAPFSAAMLKRMPALKLIVVARGGPVNIDLAAARERGVLIVNAPGRNASAVAEFTIGAIIAETRLMTRGHDALRRGTWRGDLYRADLVGRELSQMTVGVIGYGHIGTKVVRLLKAFGGRIVVADPYVELSSEDIRDGVVKTTLATLLRESDVVTLHARVTPETLGFIGRAEFAAMRKGAVVHQHRARADGRLRRADRGAEKRPSARRDARDLRRRARSRRPRTPAPRQRDAHAAHRRRLAEDNRTRRGSSRRGSAPIPRRRSPAQPLRVRAIGRTDHGVLAALSSRGAKRRGDPGVVGLATFPWIASQ